MPEILTTRSPSTETPPTSTEEPASQAQVAALAAPARLAVRHRQTDSFIAYRLLKPEILDRFSGEQVYGKTGDWVISRGAHILDVMEEDKFRHQFEVVDTSDLLIPGAARTAIESALGFGSTETPLMLVTAIRRLARLTIGTIEVEFTPAQWEDLAHRAKKRGLSVEMLVRQVVTKLSQDLWSVASGA
jgi:hypothetical protein